MLSLQSKHFTYSFDAISVVGSKFVERLLLNFGVNQAIYNTEGIEFQLDTFGCAIPNQLVLLIEVIEKLKMLADRSGFHVLGAYSWAVMSVYESF